MAENTERHPEPEARAAVDLNEDFFDFPSDDDLEQTTDVVAPAAASAPGVAGAPSDEDEDIFNFQGDPKVAASGEPVGDLARGTQHLEDLIDAVNGVEEPQADASLPVLEGYEPLGTTGLDEDVLQFESPPAPAPLKHSDLIDRREPEAKAEAPATAKSVAATAKPDEAEPGVDSVASQPTSKTKSAPSASESPAAPTSSTARQAANDALSAAKAARLAMFGSQPALVAPVAGAGWDKRLVLGVAFAFLIVNASLIVVAGKLSSSVNTALDGVREDLTRSISATQQNMPPVQVVLPPELMANLEQDASTEQPESAVAPVPAPVSTSTVLMDVASREVALAHGEIEAGECPAARRRLYRLLANRDRLIISADVLAEAEFLIAESYFAEAKKLDTLIVKDKP